MRFTRSGQLLADLYKNSSGALTWDVTSNQSTLAAYDFESGNVGMASTTPWRTLSTA